MELMMIDMSHRPQRHPLTPYTLEHNLGFAIMNNEGLHRVQSLVEEGADISRLCDNHWTPLTLAAYLGKVDIVSYLLQCIKKTSSQSFQQYRWRITVDSVNDMGQPALFCAARQGHTDVCRTLLEAGADVNGQCHYSKQTALLSAVEMKHKEVIEVLLDWAADVQLTDNVGITPLYFAVEGNSCDIVRMLIDAGCDVNIGSQDHAPLFLAARRGFLSIAEMLCDAGCYKDIANKYGVTPLTEAALKGQNNIVRCLLDQGCDINRCDMYSVSPLQAAVMMGNLEGVQMLVNAGACVKWRDIQGRCAVQMALEMGMNDILEFFLQCGIDITKRPNLTFIEPRGISPIRMVFERSVFLKTMLLLLRGCSRLDLRMLNNKEVFGSQPALLELAFASGLSHPPSRLLAEQSSSSFSPECQQWVKDYKSGPLPLKKLSRCCIRRSLGNTILHSAPKLPLPSPLVDYVLYTDAVIKE